MSLIWGAVTSDGRVSATLFESFRTEAIEQVMACIYLLCVVSCFRMTVSCCNVSSEWAPVHVFVYEPRMKLMSLIGRICACLVALGTIVCTSPFLHVENLWCVCVCACVCVCVWGGCVGRRGGHEQMGTYFYIEIVSPHLLCAYYAACVPK